MGIKSNAAIKDLPYQVVCVVCVHLKCPTLDCLLQRHSVKQKKKERKKKKMTSEVGISNVAIFSSISLHRDILLQPKSVYEKKIE